MEYRIAVITPYYKEPTEMLGQCHDSVVRQEVPCDHLMIADGFPNPAIDRWNVRHVLLPVAHDDLGNTPRSVGSLLADAEGYDFIAYLDGDNWYQPNHLASLVQLYEATKAPVCCSWRTFHRPDGSELPLPEDIASRALRHVDANCFLLHRAAFHINAVWHRMPRELKTAGDRVFRAALKKAGFAFAYSQQPTVAYRTLHEMHYEKAGEPPPEGFKPRQLMQPAVDYLMSPAGITETVDRLGFWPMSDPTFLA